MNNDDSSHFPRRLQRGLTAAHFRSAALAMGLAAASAVAAVSFLGSGSAFPLVPVVATGSLLGLVLSAKMFRRGAADLADPLDRCERVLDAMACGTLPESSTHFEPGGLENLSESVAGLLHRLHGLDAEVHAGTTRLQILVADLTPQAQREAKAILDGIRSHTPSCDTTAEQSVPCWLVDDASAPLPADAAPAVPAIDLLRLDEATAGLDLGPEWELRSTPEVALAGA